MSRFAKNTLLKSSNSNSQFLLPRTFPVEKRAICGKANIFVVIFLGLALFGWSMVIYQNILQRGAEERIAKTVWEETEYRRQTEDSIKKDIEAQKKAQAFILQLDYEKELAGFIRQEIADSESRQIQQYKKLEDSFVKEVQAYKQKQQGYEQQLVGYKAGVDEYNVLLQNNIEQMEEYKNKILGNDKKLGQLENKMDLQIKRITGYERRLAEILKILEDSKEKQKELSVQ